MSDKIAEIRERWAEFESLDHQSQVWDAHLYMRRAHNDRATLLAEVERQRAEIEGLREALRRIGMPLNKVAFCRDGHEIAVLLARNALEGKP